MEAVEFEYGQGQVTIPVEGARSVTWLKAKDMPTEALRQK